MGVYEGRGQLSKSMKLLVLHWQEAKSNWDDANTRVFSEKYMVPLEQDLRNAVAAMDHMAMFLQQVRRDCE
jgi:hypothetical protein